MTVQRRLLVTVQGIPYSDAREDDACCYYGDMRVTAGMQWD